MDGLERQRTLSDEVLERELEAALQVEPSPEFLPKLRAQIDDERGGERFRWWPWAAAIAATAVIAVAGAWLLSPEPQSSGVRLATRSADPSPARLEPVVPKPMLVPAPTVARAARRVAPRQDRPSAAPEVLVSQDEADALRRLFAAISERRFETSQLPDFDASLQPPEPIEKLEIEPITLAALDSE